MTNRFECLPSTQIKIARHQCIILPLNMAFRKPQLTRESQEGKGGVYEGRYYFYFPPVSMILPPLSQRYELYRQVGRTDIRACSYVIRDHAHSSL